MAEIEWGSLAVDEHTGLDAIERSYGRAGCDDHPFGHRFILAVDGTVFALVSGDTGYDATHIVIPRQQILAVIEDWPEVTVHTKGRLDG